MALSKTLEEFSKGNKRSGTYCAFQTLYLTLSKEDQKAIDNAVAINMPQSIIVKALRKEGYKASSDTLRTHLKGECRCPKT